MSEPLKVGSIVIDRSYVVPGEQLKELVRAIREPKPPLDFTLLNQRMTRLEASVKQIEWYLRQIYKDAKFSEEIDRFRGEG